MNDDIKRQTEELIKKTIRDELRSGAFTARKLTDTPTDGLMVVNRNYVNLNGTLANRPNSSIATIGQSYLATDTNVPLRYNGTNWVNGIGSVVALG